MVRRSFHGIEKRFRNSVHRLIKLGLKKGKDDPEITLICSKPLDADYWDTRNNRMVSLIKIPGAALTGRQVDDGVEGKMQLNPQI